MCGHSGCRQALIFRADSIEGSYPITPNFQEWQFPHDKLPPHWLLPPDVPQQHRPQARSDTSLSVGLRDAQQCRVSGRTEQCRTAHVVPVEENEWFHLNHMSDYVLDHQRRSQSAITDVNNLMLVRADLHTSFDKAKKFFFVPKKPQKDRSNMVTRLLSYSDEYTPLYHNILAYSLDPIPRPYLFARFAWAIFPQVEPFLLSRVTRRLITVAKEQQIFNAEECMEFTVPRGQRSGTGSPKKRQRNLTDGDGDNGPTSRVKRMKTEVGSQIPKLTPSPFSSLSSTAVNGPSGSPDDTSAANVRAIPESVEECENAPRPPTVEQQCSRLVDDDYFDRNHFCKVREQGLQNERQRSDPGGEWLEEVSWAMDVLRNEHSACDIQSRASVDEAKTILGEVDESREWVKEEDGLAHSI
ncbi:MAG: hypothetical protein Q9222_002209 [Ikaeria aurantiellina]